MKTGLPVVGGAELFAAPGGASANNPVLAILPECAHLQILSQTNNWVRIMAAGAFTGFVDSNQVFIPSVTVTPRQGTINVRSQPKVIENPSNVVDKACDGDLLVPAQDETDVESKLGTKASDNQWIHVCTPKGILGFVAAWLVEPLSPRTLVDQSDLNTYIDTIPAGDFLTPQEYTEFWDQRAILGLPDPFDLSPVQLESPVFENIQVNGFGPNTFAFNFRTTAYEKIRRIHNGVDHIVPAKTPLVALCDGIIVGTQAHWQFLGNAADKSLTLWCFMPEAVRDSQGRRMMSNVLVSYGHMSENNLVKRREVVCAGQVIGFSGHPPNQPNNPHLHLEIHLLSGDTTLRSGIGRLADYNRVQPFDNRTPFNPMLLFSKRLILYHQHQGKKIGFGSLPQATYPTAGMLQGAGISGWPTLDFFSIAHYRYSADSIWDVSQPPWPNGLYDLPTLLQRIAAYTPFQSYEIDFL